MVKKMTFVRIKKHASWVLHEEQKCKTILVSAFHNGTYTFNMTLQIIPDPLADSD